MHYIATYRRAKFSTVTLGEMLGEGLINSGLESYIFVPASVRFLDVVNTEI
jgi:hypothetical protein